MVDRKSAIEVLLLNLPDQKVSLVITKLSRKFRNVTRIQLVMIKTASFQNGVVGVGVKTLRDSKVVESL